MAVKIRTKNTKLPPTPPWITEEQVAVLIEGADNSTPSSFGTRNSAIVLSIFCCGLRPSEIVNLQWDHVDLLHSELTVVRSRTGQTQTLGIPNKLKSLLSALPRKNRKYVFSGPGGRQLHRNTVHWIVAETGRTAAPPLTVSPLQLRHACGFHLASRGFSSAEIQRHMGLVLKRDVARYKMAARKRQPSAAFEINPKKAN